MNGETFINKEPVGVAAVFLAALGIVWAAFPRISPAIQASVNTFAITLAAWYARKNSTPNVKVATTKKAA